MLLWMDDRRLDFQRSSRSSCTPRSAPDSVRRLRMERDSGSAQHRTEQNRTQQGRESFLPPKSSAEGNSTSSSSNAILSCRPEIPVFLTSSNGNFISCPCSCGKSLPQDRCRRHCSGPFPKTPISDSPAALH
jgi:hypothetical protein